MCGSSVGVCTCKETHSIIKLEKNQIKIKSYNKAHSNQ
jgi:hypothetical protein